MQRNPWIRGNTSSRVVIDVSCQVLNGDQLSRESWMNKKLFTVKFACEIALHVFPTITHGLELEVSF